MYYIRESIIKKMTVIFLKPGIVPGTGSPFNQRLLNK